jgi:hypothetical protein
VRDTPFEKRQHEATGKHQGNLKRSLRDIQNNHERGEREKERAKSEVDRLNKMVGSSTSTTTKAQPVDRPSAAFSQRRTANNGSLSAADQKRQWSQLAEMGIAVPDELRSDMAMAGDWQTVAQKRSDDTTTALESTIIGVRKRKLDEDEQEDVDAGLAKPERKIWGKSVRTYPGQHEQARDLDDLLAGTKQFKKDVPETKAKREPVDDATGTATGEKPTVASPTTHDPAKAASPQPKTQSSPAKSEPSDDSPSLIKAEPNTSALHHSEIEDTAAAASAVTDMPLPLFKKRKPKKSHT